MKKREFYYIIIFTIIIGIIGSYTYELVKENDQYKKELKSKLMISKKLETKLLSACTTIEQLEQELKVVSVIEVPSVETKQMELTFYTNSPTENGTYDGKVLTRSGYDITNRIDFHGLGIAASDPNVLPLNSIIEIDGLGKYIVLDTGSAIKGNKLDILVDSKEKAFELGRFTSEVKIISKGE